ncbi:unnamed protein product [Mucor hiemalis]
MSTAQNILPTAETTPDVSLVEDNRISDEITVPITEKKETGFSEEHESFPVDTSAKSEVDNGSKTANKEPLNPASAIPTPSASNNINPSAILETTMDNLANISSKIIPITQKLGKGFDQVRQYAQEKFGIAEEVTELPQEYRDLEKRVDVLAQLHQNFLKVAKTYNTPAYDYPVQFQESILGLTSTVTKQIQQLSKSVSDRAQTDPPYIPTVSQPDHPQTLSHALGRVALDGADKVGKDEALGAALDKFGTASDKLGNARLTMDHEIVSKFNTPIQVTLKTSIEGAMKARRNVQVKRLALDAAKTNYRESSTNRLDAARLQVEQAEDQFVGAVEEATHAMKTVLEDPEPLRDLADFAQIQLAFFKEAQDLFANLVPELEEIRVTQESLYRDNDEE